MLEVENICKSFDGLPVLKGVNFHVDQGETVAILGSSGSGKTTLLRCLSFLEKADQGFLKFGPYSGDITKVTKQDIRALRLRMGFVFQEYNLFRNRNVIQNVTEGLVQGRKMPKDQAEAIAVEALKKVGMADRALYYPDQLSGGQQQRVAIARAMAPAPDVILFDEPTSALDPELTGEVTDVMAHLAAEGTTMVVVTHEMGFAHASANRIVFMSGGQVAEEAEPDRFFHEPQTEAARKFLEHFFQNRIL